MNSILEAFEYVKDRLDCGTWNYGERLPTLAELAQMCCVSKTAMWKAVQLLKEKSLVCVRPRGFIYAGSKGSSGPKGNTRHGRAWERTKIQLGKEILSGTYADRRLPPTVKLALQYGVNVRTLYKSASQLVKEGLLIPDGRGFRVSQKHAAQYQPTIVLIAVGDSSHNLILKEAQTLSVVESFERECQKMGYTPRTESFDEQSSSSVLEATMAIKGFKGAAGFVVNIWNPWDETLWNRWLDLFHFIVGKNVPLVVLDQAANLPFPETLLRSKNFRVLRIAGVHAGEAVGAFLTQRGHKQAAYVTPYFDLPWAKDRYHGLNEFYKNYSADGTGVELFALDVLKDQIDLSLAVLNPSRTAVRGLFQGRFSENQIRGVLEELERIKKSNLPGKLFDQSVARTLRPFTNTLARITEGNRHVPSIAEIQHLILHLASSAGLSLYLSPFIDSIAEKSKATAWVCSDDKTALVACSALRESGRAVPGDIAVVGFNNWSDAYTHQLTSYDFDMTGMVHQALLMIMDEKYLKSEAVISEVGGYVIERRTTRR